MSTPETAKARGKNQTPGKNLKLILKIQCLENSWNKKVNPRAVLKNETNKNNQGAQSKQQRSQNILLENTTGEEYDWQAIG